MDRKRPDECNTQRSFSAIGRRTAEYYRYSSIAESLGFHYASEATSSFEFTHYLNELNKFANAYGITDCQKSALAFFTIHTEVETSHRDMAVDMLKKCKADEKDILITAKAEIDSFMYSYEFFSRP